MLVSEEVIRTITARIGELEAQRSAAKAKLEAQIAAQLRGFDIALNELKRLLASVGGEQMPLAPLEVQPVSVERAPDPVSEKERIIESVKPENVLRRAMRGGVRGGV